MAACENTPCAVKAVKLDIVERYNEYLRQEHDKQMTVIEILLSKKPEEIDFSSIKCVMRRKLVQVAMAVNPENVDLSDLESEKQRRAIEDAVTHRLADDVDLDQIKTRLQNANKCVCSNQACWKVMQDACRTYEQYEHTIRSRDKYRQMYIFSANANMEMNDQARCHVNKVVDESAKLGFQLEQKKLEILRLNHACESMRLEKTTPWHRDGEILQMKAEFGKVEKKMQDQTKIIERYREEQKKYYADIDEAKAEVETLKQEIASLKKTAKEQDEIVCAYKKCQPEELKVYTFTGKCREYTCGSNLAKLYDKWYKADQERLALSGSVQHLEDENKRLKVLGEQWKREHDLAVLGHHRPQVVDGMAVDAPEEAPPPTVMEANLRHGDLRMKLDSIFRVETTCTVRHNENDLYDQFFADQEPNKRVEVLNMLYAACHGGKQDKDRRNFSAVNKKGKRVRVFKHCFSACLRSMRGVQIRKGTKILWTNVHLRRTPIFAGEEEMAIEGSA